MPVVPASVPPVRGASRAAYPAYPTARPAQRSNRDDLGCVTWLIGSAILLGIVGLDKARIAACVDEIVAGRGKKGRVPEGWDGRAGERIADAIERLLAGTPAPKTHGPRA